MEMESSMVELDRNYVLKVKPSVSGVTGHIVLRDETGDSEGTPVFAAPELSNVDELVAWSHVALRAYREG